LEVAFFLLLCSTSMLGGIKFNAFFTFLCCCVINMWWRNFRCERLLGMLSEDQTAKTKEGVRDVFEAATRAALEKSKKKGKSCILL